MDLRAAFVGGHLHDDPITDGGVGLRVAIGGVVELAGEFAEDFAGLGLHGVIVAAQFDDHACGFELRRGLGGEGFGPRVVPAVGAEEGVFHGARRAVGRERRTGRGSFS